jgi:two-component system, cell cycle sensor histidine kinase and response regulator CckA
MNEDKKYRILVIDDNTSIHEDFRKILLRSNPSHDQLTDIESELFGFKTDKSAKIVFEIDCASNGMEGFEMALHARIDGRPYALAFVDGRMPPGWDGIETINQIWKECPELQMVLCTAYSDYSWQEIKSILGESDSLLILKKPFDNIEVLQIAHALTHKWELNHQVHQHIEKLDDLVRIRTEEKEEARMLLEAALMHSPAGIIITNEDGTKVLWSNQAAEKIYGGPVLPAICDTGKKTDIFYNAFHNDGTSYIREDLPFIRTITNEEIIRNEILLFKSNQDSNKWISYNSAPIRDSNGKIIAAIIIFNDISELKHTEIEHERLRDRLAQMQKMESVGLLAGGVAHDYNNMLSVIIGNAEMGILSADTPEPLLELLNVIKKTAHQSADLTQQLLAFARKQAITPKAFDLNKKIADILKILHRLIGENIDISFNQGANLWLVNVDPSQFDQIMFNLCVNSKDAIDGIGKIIIETMNITLSEYDIQGHPELKGRENVVLKVSDTGKGMKKEILDRIFEPFFTTKELGKGTGLGLSTVYGIIRQNNGYINVESESGKGTTFTIYLPRFEGVTMTSALEKPVIKTGIKGKKILMVEDKEEVLFIGKAMLEKLGYSVITANTPNEALIQAEKMDGNIDLLITDVIMPEMNGHDLANMLKSIHPGLRCLFMSGYSADIISEQGVLNESVHFLQKPFTFNTLAPKVEAALNE